MTNVNNGEAIVTAAAEQIVFMEQFMSNRYQADRTLAPKSIVWRMPIASEKGELTVIYSMSRSKAVQHIPAHLTFTISICSDQKYGWIAEANQQLFDLRAEALSIYAEMVANSASQQLASFLQRPEPVSTWARFSAWLASFLPNRLHPSVA